MLKSETKTSIPEDYRPDPSGRAITDHEHRVLKFVDLMNSAASGKNVAWSLSTALHALEIGIFGRNAERLSSEHVFATVAAANDAFRVARRNLPGSYPRAQLMRGYRAVVAMIVCWSSPSFSNRHSSVRDTKDLVRCLRNDMHNLSLLEGIVMRNSERISVGSNAESMQSPQTDVSSGIEIILDEGVCMEPKRHQRSR